MNYLLKCFLILFLNLVLSKSIFADEQLFLCDVENFIDTFKGKSTNDSEFVNRQLNSTYLLKVTEKEITLYDTRDENKDPQANFIIIYTVTNMKDLMSVTANPIFMESLVLNTKDKRGTLTRQGSGFTYVYSLKCR